jgi:hypothetical protein
VSVEGRPDPSRGDIPELDNIARMDQELAIRAERQATDVPDMLVLKPFARVMFFWPFQDLPFLPRGRVP